LGTPSNFKSSSKNIFGSTEMSGFNNSKNSFNHDDDNPLADKIGKEMD
jgi:hypothetical protein